MSDQIGTGPARPTIRPQQVLPAPVVIAPQPQVQTRTDGIALARGMGLAKVVPLSPALKDVDMFLYLHRRHETLVPRLAQALREMKADGSYQRILAALKVE